VGVKLSIAGLFLVPTYETAKDAAPEDADQIPKNVNDRWIRTTTAHVLPGSHRFMATVLAANLLYVYYTLSTSS